ncbi:MAG: amino acid--tRNA ligase-related protein [Candidatus Diapherotrites archaeon]
MERSHKISEINESISGKKVELCGWVDSIREFKSMVFIVLRDRYGKVQCIVSSKGHTLEEAKKLTLESCIKITGEVKKRPKNQINKDMGEQGKIEVEVLDLKIFNLCPKLPFDIKAENEEEIRLQSRFLDLRTERMQKNILLRSKTINSVLKFFEKEDFVYFETPILGKSTPEGARDYVVPSRNYPGNFYALPQSPQLFKQLSQVSGFDKYIQIARCFRDEDSRKDRQPEFTQIDVEMSFIEQNDIIDVIERMLKHVFKEVLNKDIHIPFKRISYDEAMSKYKKDNPDVRKNPEDKNEFAFCWVLDFPTFEFSKEQKRWVSVHHPFTMPVQGKKGKLDFDEKSKALAYDIVLNGSEIGGGSIRIHDPEIQEKVFDILKISKTEARNKFGFLLDALSYGAPAHGGIALGLDRLVQIMAGEDTIREVIPFPKNKVARDVMLNAPSNISKEQLNEVGLDLRKSSKKVKKK